MAICRAATWTRLLLVLLMSAYVQGCSTKVRLLSTADQNVLSRALASWQNRLTDPNLEARRGVVAPPDPEIEDLNTKLDEQWEAQWTRCNEILNELLKGSDEVRWFQVGLAVLGIATAGIIPVLNTASAANLVWSSAMGATSGISQGTLEASRRVGIDTLLAVQKHNKLVSRRSAIATERADAEAKPADERAVAKTRLNWKLKDACENVPLEEPEGLKLEEVKKLTQQIDSLNKKIETMQLENQSSQNLAPSETPLTRPVLPSSR
jgi:hypothetical protein